ncbi:MAG TPA: Dps family protein [Perlabentimonas sp.]|jgi:starvation-inducible DNA-binding protein|nr:DNA starvation/stationary phase protection protein [Bacteroidales bacterium]MDD4672284.1 DNA starvation/stationary phase protection protein [Bacteroidales bacterium]MDY0347417.1 Dps family protein [Tenuifilaceae bacterium]HZJ73915.1 Dps family protein [Perlabentimonas sp.]
MNQIGISKDYSAKMNEKLNVYLSNVQLSYMNVRGYHWNIVGKQFFQLHEKFEELYDSLNDMADEVAERILMLGGTPVHAFSKYIKMATIKEKENISTAEGTVKEAINEILELLKNEREIIELAADNGDEGTIDLMTGYISEQEKLVWMLNATLK